MSPTSYDGVGTPLHDGQSIIFGVSSHRLDRMNGEKKAFSACKRSLAYCSVVMINA